MAAAPSATPRLSHYLVLDFEATCDAGRHSNPKPQEIIEFPVLLVDAKTLQTEKTFHTYVRPTAHPILTPFCTQLTGITQSQVNDQPILPEVLHSFHSWLETNGLFEPSTSFCFVTCGDWDLKTMLPGQCRHFNWVLPEYFGTWMNIKHVFQRLTGVKAKGMPHMLEYFKIPLEGRHHSGIDDSRNIAKILARLAEMESNLQPTTRHRVN